MLELEDADHAYDVVLAANVIHLPDEPSKALGELERMCRPGGKIIISTKNGTTVMIDAGYNSARLEKR